MVNDPAIRKLVTEQTIQWSSLMERHRKNEWEFLRNQLDDQRDILRKHMEIMQATQMKQLEARHDRDMKEMNARQARISVETTKEVNRISSLYPDLLMLFFRLQMTRH